MRIYLILSCFILVAGASEGRSQDISGESDSLDEKESSKALDKIDTESIDKSKTESTNSTNSTINSKIGLNSSENSDGESGTTREPSLSSESGSSNESGNRSDPNSIRLNMEYIAQDEPTTELSIRKNLEKTPIGGPIPKPCQDVLNVVEKKKNWKVFDQNDGRIATYQEGKQVMYVGEYQSFVDATLEEVAAYLVAPERHVVYDPKCIEAEALQCAKGSLIIYERYGGVVVKDRDLVTSAFAYKPDENTLVVASSSVTSPRFPKKKKCVRAHLHKGGYVLKKVKKAIIIYYVNHVDIYPHFLWKSKAPHYLKEQLRVPAKALLQFAAEKKKQAEQNN